MQYSSILCFTEMHTINIEYHSRDIRHYHDGTWESVHKRTSHGLAFCYDTARVQIIEDEFEIFFPDLEMFPVGFRMSNFSVLLVLVHRPQSNS